MKKSTLITAWSLYCIDLIFMIYGLIFLRDHILLYMSVVSIIQAVPWVICIAHSTRSKNNPYGLWTFFIIFGATIAIPIYLLKVNRENQPVV